MLAPMARFHVIDVFALESRKLFVLAGYIADGEVHAGQSIRIPYNCRFAMEARIASIEFARRSPDREDVCLCIGYSGPDELLLWQILNIGDETLEVVAEPEPAPKTGWGMSCLKKLLRK
jgi:hypothetical protein